jgi:hypothetical protein
LLVGRRSSLSQEASHILKLQRHEFWGDVVCEKCWHGGSLEWVQNEGSLNSAYYNLFPMPNLIASLWVQDETARNDIAECNGGETNGLTVSELQ